MDQDERIEKPADLFDDRHQPLHVRLGWVALVRRRIDAIDWQRHHQRAGAAERVAVRPEHRAAILFDPFGHLAQTRIVRRADLLRREAGGSGRDLLPADRLLLDHLTSIVDL